MDTGARTLYTIPMEEGTPIFDKVPEVLPALPSDKPVSPAANPYSLHEIRRAFERKRITVSRVARVIDEAMEASYSSGEANHATRLKAAGMYLQLAKLFDAVSEDNEQLSETSYEYKMMRLIRKKIKNGPSPAD